jgi:pimeloyl-ACP methyl ester carboxylesterase
MTRVHDQATGRQLAGLAASERGDPADARPALVLLHGLTFDHTMWQPALDELAGVDPARRSLALDLPGHGRSSPSASYRIDDVVASVRAAVTEAGLQSPVVVGHSISAVIASVYGSRHPVSAVVNVDQPLRVEPFAEFVHSLRPRLESPAFPQVWQMFSDSMGIDLLPEDAQLLLRESCRPQQQLVLGYWRDMLERTPEELADWAAGRLAALRGARTPYEFVLGRPLDPSQLEWIQDRLPRAVITLLPETGHFPHLGDPRRFAERLAATAPSTT